MKVFLNLFATALLVVSSAAAVFPSAICVDLAPGDWRRHANCNWPGPDPSGGGCVDQDAMCDGATMESVLGVAHTYHTCRHNPYGICHACVQLETSTVCLEKTYFRAKACVDTNPCRRDQLMADCQTDS